MFRIIGILIFLIVLVLGVEFSAINSDPVSVNYFIGTTSLPLSLVVVCAFTVGVVVTAVIGLGVVLPLRWRIARLRRTVTVKEHELGELRGKSDREIRRA